MFEVTLYFYSNVINNYSFINKVHVNMFNKTDIEEMKIAILRKIKKKCVIV